MSEFLPLLGLLINNLRRYLVYVAVVTGSREFLNAHESLQYSQAAGAAEALERARSTMPLGGHEAVLDNSGQRGLIDHTVGAQSNGMVRTWHIVC